MMMPPRTRRIGFLWPADGINDEEFHAFLVDGISWLTARYDAGTETEELNEEVLSAYADADVLHRAARLLRSTYPEVVACGDHAASFISGMAGERGMIEAIETTLGCPAVTVGMAVREALEALGARRIAVVSPYSAPVTDALRAYLSEAGIEVDACHVAGATSEIDIATRAPKAWLQELLALALALEDRPDALLLAGGGVCFAASITEFETRTGIPVVTAPGALVRAATAKLGVPHWRPGVGCLFRQKGQSSVPRIAQLQSTGTKSFSLSASPPVFVAGAGARLEDENGLSYLDFASGSGTTALGHGHPELLGALERQTAGGLLHLGPHFHAPVQAELYELLSRILPPHLERFHPSVSGTEATEVAIKAAMHATGERHFIGFEGGYHGRTFGALSVSGARGRNEALGPFSPAATILPFPADASTGHAAATEIVARKDELAGVIMEPIQATAGLRVANREAIAAVAAACAEARVPLIVDEVFTGFGRTGRMFAFEHYDLSPDLVVLGKSFGGGLPAGLVAGRADLLASWPKGVQTSTFQLHPASAATSKAFIEVLLREKLTERAERLAPAFGKYLAPLRDLEKVRELRGVGAFWVLAMASPTVAAQARLRALEAGLITWECGLEGDVIGLVPPLIVEEKDVAEAAAILITALS